MAKCKRIGMKPRVSTPERKSFNASRNESGGPSPSLWSASRSKRVPSSSPTISRSGAKSPSQPTSPARGRMGALRRLDQCLAEEFQHRDEPPVLPHGGEGDDPRSGLVVV